MRVIEKTTPKAFIDLVSVLRDKDDQESRYGDTQEEWMVTVKSDNPRERMLFRPNINWAFGLQECWAYWRGRNPGHVERYNSRMKEFMYEDDDGGERLHGSAYGRYFRRMPHNQIARVLRMLERNPETRRAIINVHQAGIEDYDKGDVACTIYLHPVIRNGKLHMTANLRSQDILWGYPYDAQAFQWLQEVMAGILDVELGTYTHIMNSCHYYSEREEQLIDAANEAYAMELPDARVDFDALKYIERSMDQGLHRAREGKVPNEEIEYLEDKSQFYSDWLRMMASYEQSRFHGDEEAAERLTNNIEVDAFSHFMRS